MCGIFGMVGTLQEENYSEAHAILCNIFKASVSRGGDSSGFSAIHLDKPGVLITEKRPIDSGKFVSRSSKFKSLRGNMPNIVIGHTRLSTSGNPNRNRNNHPFNSQRYSLVHNGGIREWPQAVKSLDIPMRTETDSEILLHLLERTDDPHKSIQNIINSVGDGSRIAIAAIDYAKEKPNLLMFRNNSNDIFVMSHPGFNVMFFASTKAILQKGLELTFGEKSKKHIEKNRVIIDKTDSFLSQEIGISDDNGAPYVISENRIEEKPYYKVIIPTYPGGRSPIPRYPLSKLPASSVVKSDIDIFKALNSDDMPNQTRKDVLRLSKVIRTSGEILRSIRDNDYMSAEEIADYESWRDIV